MPSYRYEARRSSGAAVKGSLDASDRQAALRQLSEQGIFPSVLESESLPSPRSVPVTSGAETAAGGAPRHRVRRKEIAVLTRELATMLAAGIPILSTLEGLRAEEEREGLRNLIGDLAAGVRRGEPLSTTMEMYPHLFSTLYTGMVRVGEEAGALGTVMSDLADLLEHEEELRGEVLGAVAYPVFVLVMGIVTAFILLAFVLPRLFEMLQEMIAVLPLPTRILLALSSVFQDHWPWLLAGAAGTILAVRAYLRSPGGGLLWDGCKLRLPVLGPVFQAAALGRFSRTLGTLTRSGVPLLPALGIVQKTVGNRRMSRAVEQAAEETRAGEPLASPLRRLGLFPATMVQMISVGEESGHLGDMLLRVADIQERYLRERSRTLISLLAPALIVLVGGLIGFIVIGLLLPIFQMSHSMR